MKIKTLYSFFFLINKPYVIKQQFLFFAWEAKCLGTILNLSWTPELNISKQWLQFLIYIIINKGLLIL